MKLPIALLLMTLTPGFTAFSAEPAPGTQVEQELKSSSGTIPYLLYLPEDYASRDGKLPLLFFLHGRGESDGPLSVVAKWGPPRLLRRGEKLPFIVVSPQCPRSDSWGSPSQQKLLVQLLDHLQQALKVDADRIYLTGLSMGGFGSWRLAADHPERFAAVVPICGGGRTDDADKLKNLPIWVWHGVDDPTVPVQRSAEMVEAIKKAGGGKIRFTTLEGIGHNSWEAAYASPDLYAWLLKQTASGNKARERHCSVRGFCLACA